MSADAPARLTGALLARKGRAAPAGLTIRAGPPTAESRNAGDTAAPPTAGRDRARLTLRLDDPRHLRLRLTAAHLQCSLQEIMIAALDSYLDRLGPDVLGRRCGCLADTLERDCRGE